MRSMTGYGMGEVSWKSGKLTFEVKTVNHRFCEVNIRLPSRLYPLEAELSEFTKKIFSRGRIDIYIRENAGTARGAVKVDEAQLKRYLQLVKKLSRELKQSEPVRAEALLALPQVIVLEEEPDDLKEALNIVKKGLEKVFAKVEKMRETEGESLKQEFLNHLSRVGDFAKKIEEKVPEILKDYQERLKERIEKLAGQNPDEWRLAQEVAYFVDRTDISEEIQRLKSHLVYFKEVLKEKGPVGRKLDFIMQEMNREVNTLGAKSQDGEISKSVVACKHELEKMREQVQNVE